MADAIGDPTSLLTFVFLWGYSERLLSPV